MRKALFENYAAEEHLVAPALRAFPTKLFVETTTRCNLKTGLATLYGGACASTMAAFSSNGMSGGAAHGKGGWGTSEAHISGYQSGSGCSGSGCGSGSRSDSGMDENAADGGGGPKSRARAEI